MDDKLLWDGPNIGESRRRHDRQFRMTWRFSYPRSGRVGNLHGGNEVPKNSLGGGYLNHIPNMKILKFAGKCIQMSLTAQHHIRDAS